MARKVFFSFHYANDAWKVGQVRNIWVTKNKSEDLPAFYDKADWEKIKRKGDTAIQNWINDQMFGASCVIVLNGQQTKGRPWVQYEIRKAHADGKAMFGINLDNIKDRNGNTHAKGLNPFSGWKKGGKELYWENIYKVYSPANYQEIYDNIDSWIEIAFKESQNRLR